MIVVRRAGPTDADAISALNNDVQAVHATAIPWRFKAPGADTFPPSEIAKLMQAAHIAFFLAEYDEVPAGYLLAEVQRRKETSQTYAHDMVYVHHDSVQPALRRHGIGRALLGAATIPLSVSKSWC